jgi:hypothetical protein
MIGWYLCNLIPKSRESGEKRPLSTASRNFPARARSAPGHQGTTRGLQAFKRRVLQRSRRAAGLWEAWVCSHPHRAPACVEQDRNLLRGARPYACLTKAH